MRRATLPIAIALMAATITASLAPAPRAEAATKKVDANGWKFTVSTTSSDGIAITWAEYQGVRVFKRISVPQVLVLYDSHPTMHDQLGANVPYVGGSLKVGTDANKIDVRARYIEHDYPDDHSYRYDVRYIFYTDGEIRTRVYAYGPGLEPTHRYEVDFRFDIDVGGSSRDFFQHFRTNLWTAPKRECRCPDRGERDRGAEWLVFDGRRGDGWRIHPGLLDGAPDLWAVRWRDGQGNTDVAAVTQPDDLANGQWLQFDNIVLWYRAKAEYERGPNCPGACTKALITGPTFKPFGF